MAMYSSYSQPISQPAYATTYHHPASAHPHLYQTSAFSVPTIHSSPSREMPTYYVGSTPSHSSRRSRSRSRSRHTQPVVYTSSSGGVQYLTPHSDSGRRHRSSSVGHGTHYYTAGGHSSSHRSSSRSPNLYYTPSTPSHHHSGRRSHSTSRHSGTQYVSSSGRRPSVSYVRTLICHACLPVH